MQTNPRRTGGFLRRFGVFVFGAVLGAVLLWGSAFAGLALGLSGAGPFAERGTCVHRIS